MKVLKEAQRRFGFAIDVVDIDHDPDLVAKYNTEVPVVTVNGKVRFRGVVNPALLERLLWRNVDSQGSSNSAGRAERNDRAATAESAWPQYAEVPSSLPPRFLAQRSARASNRLSGSTKPGNKGVS